MFKSCQINQSDEEQNGDLEIQDSELDNGSDSQEEAIISENVQMQGQENGIGDEQVESSDADDDGKFDRVNIELCSKRMQRISMRSPYKGLCLDNSVLDFNYTMVQPILSLNIAGNRINVPSLTSTERVSSAKSDLSTQPPTFIITTKALIKRFARQIQQIRLGGITDCERRLGYIPDHQVLFINESPDYGQGILVVTRDICEVIDTLPHATSLSLRNCCISVDAVKFWSGEETSLMHRISSLCIHSIWFDRMEDCENFVNILSPSIRRIHLSDCGAMTITNIMKKVDEMNVKIDYFYIAIDLRTFTNVPEAITVLQNVNKKTKELHLCICMTSYASEEGYRLMLRVLPRIVDLNTITTLQLDVGSFRPLNHRCFKRFFNGKFFDSADLNILKELFAVIQIQSSGLMYMQNLRSLFLSGCAIAYHSRSMWSDMIKGVSQLSNLEFLSIHELCKNTLPADLDAMCVSLPQSLLSFAIGNSLRFTDDNLQHLVERCPKLESLCLRGLRKVRMLAIESAIRALPHLRRLAICRMGPMNESIYKMISDKNITPSLEAVILGGNKGPLSSEVLPQLHARFQTVMFICHSSRWKESEYSMWRVQDAYMKLLASSWFTECPCCEKDVSLIDYDDFY
ncbi:unnamed protein product [Anisakis simplex]|uniref:F-box domain-containing protein n=1 Tax=Anisakis simplex TaxID=6269 RepID=A0A0M3JW19_ANISI|nr:unnamed protein product [Anisakis simplex]